MMGPPTNSAAMNCQPSNTSITMPSSMTRFVDAIMNTMAATKSAPLAKSDFDMADAAYEQLDDTMPYPAARPTAAGRWLPSFACICSFETNAWTTPESVKPRTRAQSVSQNMKKPSRMLLPMPTNTETDASMCITSAPSER